MAASREGGSHNLLPERMFAFGDEPIGVRVTPYHKPFAITQILRALDEEEVEVLRRSQFGRLVEIAGKPTFSGRFGRYLISRQLKVRKKHEAWFLFAGKPVRFSLREFALVTGLNCGPYPKNQNKRAKSQICEKPYWGELFGTMKEVPVTSVVRLLKNREVAEKETRIKFALLALLASVILPTTHTPKISHEHAEMIKELDSFLAFPWGRMSFDLLITSIKERNEVSLSQNTIALKGFVLALQLVMIEAVPALTEGVHEGGSSDSEGDFAEEEDLGAELCQVRKSISPGHAREADCAGKATVMSIIPAGTTDLGGESELAWSDEEDDVSVDNLLQRIQEGATLSHSSFTGGATKADVVKMREEGKAEAEIRRTSKNKANVTPVDAAGVEFIASRVKARVFEDLVRVSKDLTRIETQVKNLSEEFGNFQTVVVEHIEEMFNRLQAEILKMLKTQCSLPQQSATQSVGEDFPILSRKNINQSEPTIPSPRPNDIVNEDNVFNSKNHETGAHSSDVACPLERNSSQLDATNIIQNVMRAVDKSGTDKSNEQTAAAEGTGDQDISHTDGVQTTSVMGSVEQSRVDQTVGDADTRNKEISHTEGSLDPRLLFPKPTFSLGLTQEDRNKGKTSEVDEPGRTGDGDMESFDYVQPDAPGIPCRKSKRQKVLTRALVGDYECDKTFLTRAWESYVGRKSSGDTIEEADKFAKLIEMLKKPFSFHVDGVKVDSKDLSALISKTAHIPAKVVDVLVHHIRAVNTSQSDQVTPPLSAFLDTKFVSQLSKTFTRFSKCGKKESFKFPSHLCESLVAVSTNLDAPRFYFPFNLEKAHWVGVCIDTANWQLLVLDCNTSFRNESQMTKEMRPLAVMFPYLLKQAGKPLSTKDMKALAIDRPRNVPQNHSQFESAITAILLIQAHAFGGLDVCKCITSNVLDAHVVRASVQIVDENHGIV